MYTKSAGSTYRELDYTLGLTALAEDRYGKNDRHWPRRHGLSHRKVSPDYP